MWVYEKALQFNVDIKNKDARMAKHIIAQYGGPFCISSKYKSSSIFLYIKGLTA